jgi:hypothetical protein
VTRECTIPSTEVREDALVEDMTAADTDRLAAAQAEFDAEVAYLNTATLGLPPRRS